MDRAHRLGQRRTVNVYRLLVRGTLEEQIMSLQQFKLDVAATLVNQDNVSLGAMDTSGLLDLFTTQARKAPRAPASAPVFFRWQRQGSGTSGAKCRSLHGCVAVFGGQEGRTAGAIMPLAAG